MMGKAIAQYEGFAAALDERAPTIKAVLPSHVSMERFKAVALSAASQRPEILKCTPNTLFGAITKAAQDGLLPDGREGVILSHRTKHRYRDSDGKWRDRWTDDAAWIPMIHGQRKRAKELENIIVASEVVYENDHFMLVFGDEPRLEHTPAGLGKQRGEPIGAYAIYRIDGVIVHREVMDRDQIMAVRAKSKNPDGMLWSAMWTEGWRKTVIKRGFKAVPVGESLDRIIERDNEMYALDGDGTVIDSSTPRPPAVGSRRAPERVVHVATGGVAAELPPVVGETDPPDESESAEGGEQDSWLKDYDSEQQEATQ